MKNAFENIMKSKIKSLIAILFVVAFLAMHFVGVPDLQAIAGLKDIIILIIGYYFGSSDKEDKNKID